MYYTGNSFSASEEHARVMNVQDAMIRMAFFKTMHNYRREEPVMELDTRHWLLRRFFPRRQPKPAAGFRQIFVYDVIGVD